MAYIFISGDQKKFDVSRETAVMSALVCSMLEDNDHTTTVEIPLPNVHSKILEMIVRFCVHHVIHPMQAISKPLKGTTMKDLVSEWDAEFIDNLSQTDLFELVKAANYMDIGCLLDLSCAKIASTLRGKTPQEIRENMGITTDFTPEEEARIKEENKWVLE